MVASTWLPTGKQSRSSWPVRLVNSQTTIIPSTMMVKVQTVDWRDIFRSNIRDVHIEDYTGWVLGVVYAGESSSDISRNDLQADFAW